MYCWLLGGQYFNFVTAENDTSKCLETFCYFISECLLVFVLKLFAAKSTVFQT